MIEEIRQENLCTLRDEYGSVVSLAAHLERSESQISQWINASTNSGTGKPRSMRSSTARWIEERCGKPMGWLDIDHSVNVEEKTDNSLPLEMGIPQESLDKSALAAQVFESLCHALDISVDQGILAILTRNKSGRSPMENNPYKEIAAKIKQQQDQLRESIPRLAEKAMGAQTQDTRKVSGSK